MIKFVSDRTMFVVCAFLCVLIVALVIAGFAGLAAMIRYLTGGIWAI